jgi:hypothetical protein
MAGRVDSRRTMTANWRLKRGSVPVFFAHSRESSSTGAGHLAVVVQRHVITGEPYPAPAPRPHKIRDSCPGQVC